MARPRLSRPRVVHEAVALVDEDGLDALTMRNLADRLGVQAMALYKHVANRDHLLDLMADTLLDDLRAEPALVHARADSWQAFLTMLGTGVRAVAITHPNVFPLVAGRPTAAPWLRPPLRSLDWVEDFLGALSERGFPPRAAAQAYRRFTGFLVGDLLLEISGRQTAPPATNEIDLAGDPIRFAAEYPTMARLAPQLLRRDDEHEFEEGLRGMVETIERLRARR